MSSSRLFLTGVRASGRHGASPGERDAPQEFVVDLDVDVAFDADRLDATADYRSIAQAVRATVERESFELLETLAAAVAEAVAELDAVEGARAVVHKPAAARSLGIDGIAATAQAGRAPGAPRLD